MLPNPSYTFLVYFIVKNFEKVFIYYFAINNIVIYCITIILNIQNKIVD